MPLSAGARLGPYVISSPLGAGGMGEVYRARDEKLGREVALKTLPESFTHDPERVARFRREAQLLAAINHPHIAAIYDIQEIDGRHLLVLELVDGETLAARLRRGALPVDEALGIAREIALALEAAHERGIVHRDLKPGNIALAADGNVKVLDFGLARAGDSRSGVSQPEMENSPTITSPLTLTALGVILGTAAYMSPEQARGMVADRRSDVWAFGCVLYEMLTARRAFAGEDVTDTLAAVVKSPPDWSALPAAVPPAVRALLEGCLEKDRRRRIADISVARFVLERFSALDAPRFSALDAPSRDESPRSTAWRWAPWALAAAAVALAGAALVTGTRDTPQAPAVTRFAIDVPDAQQLGQERRSIAISPRGDRIAYSAGGRLYLRALSDFESQPLPGADVGLQPVFAPDGQSLVFWANGALRRIPLVGGVPVLVAEVSPAPLSVTWTDRGIVFTEFTRGVLHVSPAGGAPTVLMPFKDIDGLTQGAHILPDGDTLLFAQAGVIGSPTNFWDAGRITIHSIRTGERTVLIEGGSNPLYLDTGHIVYSLEGTLMAVPFDLRTREVTGAAVPVVSGVRRTAPAAGGQAQIAVSASGTLAYIPGPERMGQESIFVYAEDGAAQSLELPLGTYGHPRVSPDGQSLAFEIHDGKEWWIAVHRLSGSTAAQRLTFGGNNRFPVWTRDGRRIVFQSDRDGDLALFWQGVSGGAAERLTRPEPQTAHVPDAWSPRADVLLFSVAKESNQALWTLSMPGREVAPFGDVSSYILPAAAAFSPDGRWVAYQAGDGDAGEGMTFVQPFPATGTKYQIARGGRPLWSPDGRRLYFVPAPGQFLAVAVTATDEGIAFTSPEEIPRRFGLAPPSSARSFDVLADGRIVGINTPPEAAFSVNQILVVQHWLEELKAKVPGARTP
jgi:eukaryotic-like serine/threonine-protein kinase